MPSPLFKNANAQLRRAAMSEFRGTKLGQLFQMADKAQRGAAGNPRALAYLMQRSMGQNPQRMLRDLMGVDWGTTVQTVMRYSGGNTFQSHAVDEFLNALGPAGQVLRAITREFSQGAKAGGQPFEVGAAIRLLQAFGYEVLGSPDEMRKLRGAPRARAIDVATEVLRTLAPERLADTPEQPPDEPRRTGQARDDHWSKSHPVFTGRMKKVVSSNVHSWGYDPDTNNLYVRFLGGSRDERRGKGPMYVYHQVGPELAASLDHASSKGDWVWDNLRVRGTAAGHQYPYDLVAVSGDYVPRKASLVRGGEAFVRRINWTTRSGRQLTSPMETELVRPMRPEGPVPPHMRHLFGEVRRNEPNRATPNRGQPNRG